MNMKMEAGRLNMVNLSANGTFEKTGGLSTKPEDIDDIFALLKTGSPRHLVLYFHGGLVSEHDGKGVADALMRLFAEKLKAHPVFFLWESGLLEVLRDRLRNIEEQSLFKRAHDILLSHTRNKLAGQGGVPNRVVALGEEIDVALVGAVGLMPDADIEESTRQRLEGVSSDERVDLAKELLADPLFQAAQQELRDHFDARGPRGLASSGTADDEFSPRVLIPEALKNHLREVSAQASSTGTAVLAVSEVLVIFNRIIDRFRRGTDHGLPCTVTEEIVREFYLDRVGADIWDRMKEQIRKAFLPNDNLTGEQQHGGTYLLEKLREYLEDDTISPAKVSLVGHSAGAVYICKLLEKVVEILPADFRFEHVVMLAPAADFDLFEAVILKNQGRFASFRMFALQDTFESADEIAGSIYTRSLLYLISGLLEREQDKPLVGMERYYSGRQPYDSPKFSPTRTFMLESGRDRAVWAVAAGKPPGLNCGAERHGAFDEDATTQESLKTLLGSL